MMFILNDHIDDYIGIVVNPDDPKITLHLKEIIPQDTPIDMKSLKILNF
jgi:hypothetical protein